MTTLKTILTFHTPKPISLPLNTNQKEWVLASALSHLSLSTSSRSILALKLKKVQTNKDKNREGNGESVKSIVAQPAASTEDHGGEKVGDELLEAGKEVEELVEEDTIMDMIDNTPQGPAYPTIFSTQITPLITLPEFPTTEAAVSTPITHIPHNGMDIEQVLPTIPRDPNLKPRRKPLDPHNTLFIPKPKNHHQHHHPHHLLNPTLQQLPDHNWHNWATTQRAPSPTGGKVPKLRTTNRNRSHVFRADRIAKAPEHAPIQGIIESLVERINLFQDLNVRVKATEKGTPERQSELIAFEKASEEALKSIDIVEEGANLIKMELIMVGPNLFEKDNPLDTNTIIGSAGPSTTLKRGLGAVVRNLAESEVEEFWGDRALGIKAKAQHIDQVWRHRVEEYVGALPN